MLTFDSVLGQEQLKKQLQKAAEEGRPSHAYLIAGEKGSGKRTIAKCFAKALQCTGEGSRPCGKCQSCLQMEDGSQPDVIYIEPDEKDSIGVGTVRERINDDIVIKPYRGPYKIYLVCDAQKMTVQAQNALLKTLEEPPKYAVLLLLTSSVEQILPTIQSRSVRLSMQPLPDETIRRYLMNSFKVPDYEADTYVTFARGNLGSATELLKNEDFETKKEEAIALLKSIDSADFGELYLKAAALGKEKDMGILNFFYIWYRDALCYKAMNQSEGLIFKEEIQYIKKVSREISYEGFEEIFAALLKTQEMIRANVNMETAMELLFVAIRDCRKE